MNFCRNCGANVDGLVGHCDLCGTPLTMDNNVFLWHIFVTAGAGDLPQHVKKIFTEMNQIAVNHQEALLRVTFNIYCYPSEMVQCHGIKNSMRIFSRKREVSIKLVVDYERYINSAASEKECLIRNAILNTLSQLRHRFEKSHINLDNFWCDIETVMS